MNNTLWKLDKIADKLWHISSAIAVEASKHGIDGRGFAIIADETYAISTKLSQAVENSLIYDEKIKGNDLLSTAKELNYLAINNTLESVRKKHYGKAIAIHAENLRRLIVELEELLGDKKQKNCLSVPYAEHIMTSVDERICFLQFTIWGYRITENINFIMEVLYNVPVYNQTHIRARNLEIPIIDCYTLLNKAKETQTYILLKTPWANNNDIYAVAADDIDIHAIFYSPIGTPISHNDKTPLSDYIREYWQSTDTDPFRFMDWPKLLINQ